MVVPYALLENVIISEFLLVIFIILLTYALKYYFYLQVKKDKRITAQAESYLVPISADNSPIVESAIPKSWRRLDILLPLLFKLDTTMQNPSWPETKKEFVRTILLPIARKKHSSRIWMNRLLSAQCFELLMEKEDEDSVATLLEDKIPIVQLHATIAAIIFSSFTMINLVINNMSKHRRLGQSVYLKIFNKSQPQTWEIVESRLNTEKDPFVRATSYKILLTLSHYISPIDINADLHSDNLELRLAAIRYLAAAQKKQAISVLINFLSDEHWEIRATCARLLGELEAVQALPEIAKGLRDSTWWVRVASANALKNFGEPGLEILNSQDPSVDLYAYETSMYVLNKPFKLNRIGNL